MTARSFIVRCSHCKTADTVGGTLEAARQMRCGICHQKMTVMGHRDQDETKPGEPPAVTTAPGIETAFWKMTPEQIEVARGLALSALGKEQSNA